MLNHPNIRFYHSRLDTFRNSTTIRHHMSIDPSNIKQRHLRIKSAKVSNQLCYFRQIHTHTDMSPHSVNHSLLLESPKYSSPIPWCILAPSMLHVDYSRFSKRRRPAAHVLFHQPRLRSSMYQFLADPPA